MKNYKANEVCEILGITIWTLTNWYQWERISLEDGTLSEKVLPTAIRVDGIKGRPRVWTAEQIEQLKAFQKTIVHGRNGVMAKVTNPKSRQARNK